MPTRMEPDDYVVMFAADRATFRRRDEDISTNLEIAVSAEDDVEVRRVTIRNHGTRMREIDVTSYAELYRDGHAVERWNRLHPGEPSRVPYVTQCFAGTEGVIVAASDYVKILPDGIGRWLPRPLTSLGTDGFGRSENRAALRDFFEVDAKFVVASTLSALARDGKITREVVEKAIKDLGINTEKPNPAVS